MIDAIIISLKVSLLVYGLFSLIQGDTFPLFIWCVAMVGDAIMFPKKANGR